MSERKTTCPLCQRPPGGIHAHECPRSRASTRQLAARMRERARGREVWQFGEHVIFVPGKGNQITNNPGIPYVDQTRGKSWNAGGTPRGLASKQREFRRHLNARLAQQRAQEKKGVRDGIAV